MNDMTPDQKWAYKCYGHWSTGRIKSQIGTLKYEMTHLKPERSGQASNYYAPFIHYLRVELARRGEGE
jgi:hypothetical protein